MLLATFAVAVLPVLVVSAIQLTGALRSALSSVAVAAALSLAASLAGSALWSRRRGSRDVVFADLMIWGWVRRLRTERRLADARELLGDRAKWSTTPRSVWALVNSGFAESGGGPGNMPARDTCARAASASGGSRASGALAAVTSDARHIRARPH